MYSPLIDATHDGPFYHALADGSIFKTAHRIDPPDAENLFQADSRKTYLIINGESPQTVRRLLHELKRAMLASQLTRLFEES